MCSEDLTLSSPNGCSYFSEVEQKDVPLTSLCCDAENQYFQQVNLRTHLLFLNSLANINLSAKYNSLFICRVENINAV